MSQQSWVNKVMTDKNTQSADAAAEKELEGVPEHMKDDASEATDAADAAPVPPLLVAATVNV